MEDSTSQIISIVERMKKEAAAAEKDFDYRSSKVQSRARSSINIFDSDAGSRAVNIVAEARMACDELYASYQLLINRTDSLCRPLLDSKTSADAIKKVADFIRFLNDESEIENNFSSSFNGVGRGNFAGSKYMPTLESRMIQKFWEAKYADTPEAAEEKKQRAEKLALERKRREVLRAKEVLMKKEQQQLIVEQKEHMEKVCSECEDKISRYHEALKSEKERRMKQVASDILKYVEQLKKQKEEAEKEISSLGIFRIKQKNEKKGFVEALDIKIAKLCDEDIIKAEDERLNKIVDCEADDYKQIVDKYLDSRFPNRGARAERNKYFERIEFAYKPCPDMPKAKTIFEKI